MSDIQIQLTRCGFEWTGIVGVWMEDAVSDAMRYIDRLSASTEVDDMMHYDDTDGSGGYNGEDFATQSPPFPSVSSERV